MTRPEGARLRAPCLARAPLITTTKKVDTAHESITRGGELMPPRDPGVSLIRPTNLSDSQIIGNLLDSVGKEILTLIIHSVRGCISSRSVPPGGRPRWCVWRVRKMQCRNGNEPLSRWTISFSYLFLHSFVLLSTSSFPFWLFLCRFSSLSHILSLPTLTLSELKIKNRRPWRYFLTFTSRRYMPI